MKKLLLGVSFAAVAAGVLVPSAQASLFGPVNAGFETGDFTGWTVSNPAYAAVLGTYTATPTADGRVYLPQEGSKFALVAAGGSPTTGLSGIAQTFHMKVGDTLTGYAGFDARDDANHNDTAIALIKVISTAVLYSKNVSQVGAFGSSPWESWTFTAKVEEDYTVAFLVGNAVDNDQRFNSRGVFDMAYTAASRVPDASSALLLLGCGLTGVEGLRRRYGRR